jgi:hypothetical protein
MMNGKNPKEEQNIYDLNQKRQQVLQAKKAAQKQQAAQPGSWRRRKVWFAVQSVIYVLVIYLAFITCQNT